MWTVLPDIAIREIGKTKVELLKELRNWLYPNASGELEFRTAPSLVARCEVELFAVSMPRFAFRAYLTRKSFINARRIETFRRLATYWGDPPPRDYERVDLASKKNPPQVTMLKSSCVGDSLLEFPGRWDREIFHVLSTQLGLAYGEDEEVEGTPFVNHIRLGGGMCAQAVCFMATALQQHTTRGIYGVAEITALASDEHVRALDLGGMTAQKMCSYFNHPKVGLSALRQVILISEQNPAIPILRFGEAVRSYVLSDMPVILLVDLGRMLGVEWKKDGDRATKKKNDEYLFIGNELSEKLMEIVEEYRNKAERKMRHHALLIVGCQVTRGGEGAECIEFLVNDPTTYPFLKASAADLANVRLYDEKRWDEGGLGPIQFISVTPQELRLPLMDLHTGLEMRWGLEKIAVAIQSDTSLPQLPVFASPTDPMGETRLVDLHWCEKSSVDGDEDKDEIDPRFNERLAHIDEACREKLVLLVAGGDIPPKWCWIHSGPSETADGLRVDSVWVWDATVPPPDDGTPLAELRKKYLLAVLTKEDEAWNCAYTCPKPLRPALISSFGTRSVSDVASQWPENPTPAVDLYVFMQPEVEKWLRQHGQPAGPPTGPNHAVAFMAACADNKAVIDEWADSVCKSFGPEQKPIVATASFVPEVTSLDRDSYEMACNALRFLLRFATALRRSGHQDLRTVELVVGSRIGGIWPARGGSYVATWMDTDVACRRVLSILGRVLCECANCPPEDRIVLALELEPGPMFLLRDWESLVEVCQQIAKDPLLSRFVGVNVDIAHWRLARDITPERVWDTPEVRDRIVHGHLSGHHHCSHFGDLPPFDLNAAKDFRPWIELLRRIAADWRDPELPQFSGYVSLELEAAKELRIVTKSVLQLVNLI